MQVVERLVGDDARRHVHDVTLGDGLGLGIGVERRAEQGHRGRRRRGGEGDEELVAVVLADDLGDLLFFVLAVVLGILGVGIVRLAERHADGHAHLPLLRAVRLVDQERHAQVLQLRVLLDLLQHPGELLLRGDDDRLALLQETRQVVRLPRQAHHVLQVRELLDVLADVGVERLAVREDEDDVHQLVAGAGLEQAVQPVGQPADRQRLAAAGRVVDQILAPDVARRSEMRHGIVGHLPHHAALVVARQDGEGRPLRPVLFGLALGHADQKERQRLQQLVLRQHFAVEELDRVFALGLRRVGQPGVVPAEVLHPARVGRGHHVAGVGGQVEEGMPEAVCGYGRARRTAPRRHARSGSSRASPPAPRWAGR